MGYEANTGLGVNNHYGARRTGGSKGVHKTEGLRNEFIIDLAQAAALTSDLFPRGDGVRVVGVSQAFTTGTVTALAVGGVSILTASEASPVSLTKTNTGAITRTGGTAGKIIVYYINVAGDRDNELPAIP